MPRKLPTRSREPDRLTARQELELLKRYMLFLLRCAIKPRGASSNDDRMQAKEFAELHGSRLGVDIPETSISALQNGKRRLGNNWALYCDIFGLSVGQAMADAHRWYEAQQRRKGGHVLLIDHRVQEVRKANRGLRTKETEFSLTARGGNMDDPRATFDRVLHQVQRVRGAPIPKRVMDLALGEVAFDRSEQQWSELFAKLLDLHDRGELEASERQSRDIEDDLARSHSRIPRAKPTGDDEPK